MASDVFPDAHYAHIRAVMDGVTVAHWLGDPRGESRASGMLVHGVLGFVERGWLLALVVDIDNLRTHLGQWDAHQESRLLARDLAIALVKCHLDAGHEVVVPQFLGRLEFIERLEAQPNVAASRSSRCS